MAHMFNGQVLLANGLPAVNVQVRIFDKEPPGMVDDDLTMVEGISDEQGRFMVHCNSSRFVDFTELMAHQPDYIPFDWTRETVGQERPLYSDIRLPYLQFRYNMGGGVRTHTAFIHPFKEVFRLPDLSPVEFRPSRHGFAFANNFADYQLPFSVPTLPDLALTVPGTFGLGGGMTLAALDFLIANQPLPEFETAPFSGPLYEYLYRRQIDSFGVYGQQIVRLGHWMGLPPDTLYGTQRHTFNQVEQIKKSLDVGNPVPLNLVYFSGDYVERVWDNHQVLACEYTDYFGGQLDLLIYDPDYPGQDNVLLRCDEIPVGEGDPSSGGHTGFDCVLVVGDEETPIHGFFAYPYVPVTPPIL